MVDVPQSVVVAVLTRAPSRGGKSRLFASLGCPYDAALVSALLLDTIDGASLTGTRCIVAVDPPDGCSEVRALLPGDVRVIAQADGSLGDRMRAAMREVLADGDTAVVVIGSDLPDITPAVIERAVSHLARDPASLVLGPATDGGYYLMAATRVPDVFEGIEWGSPRVLQQTEAAAARCGLRVHLVEPLRDVDTAEDLQLVVAPRTRAWVTAHRRWSA